MALKIIDILGVALILGLLLRYGQEATQLISTSSTSVSQVYGTAGLFGVPAPPVRG